MNPIGRDEAEHFFDDFVEAFATFDGAVVARRYRTPFLALGSAGAATVLTTVDEIAAYFQEFLDDYRAQGCRSCRYVDLAVVGTGTTSGLVTATWELLDGGGSVVQSWRESYVVVREGAALRVSASVDHAD